MIEWHDSLDSTQDRAHALAQAGAPHLTAVAARRQTEGRGTRGRRWASGDGGLWISVVVRPRSAEWIELLGLRTALALAERLEQAAGGRLELRLKWPNDIYQMDRKLAGLLAEARWQGDVAGWVVIGIGINLYNRLPDEVAARSTRTADFGWRPDPTLVAPIAVDAAGYAARASGRLDPNELEALTVRDWLAGRRIGRPVAGTVEGVTAEGRLRVRPDGGPPIELLDSSELSLER